MHSYENVNQLVSFFIDIAISNGWVNTGLRVLVLLERHATVVEELRTIFTVCDG